MNQSFIKDDEKISIISQRDLVLIIVGGIISTFLGLFLTIPMGLSHEFIPLLNTVNIVGMTFATGLFSFLTAGLLFSSQASRSYLLRRINEVGPKRAFRIRVLYTFAITCIFTFIIAIIAFIRIIILDTLTYFPGGINYFAFLPSVLGASMFVSICLVSIAIAIASTMDDSRICVVLGCVSTIVIAAVAGLSATPNSIHYSIIRNIALLSPHNIVRALAVQLSGYQFEFTTEMVRYVGFVVSAESLAVALLMFITISILLLFAGERVLSKNSTRWTVLQGMIPSHEIWESSFSAEKLQEINRIRRGLKVQRGLTTMIVGALLISMFAGMSMYSISIVNSTTYIHYMSPQDGERIPVGTWMIFDVDVRPPHPGLFNQLFFGIYVENWGNTSGMVNFYYGILEMTSTEFDLLDESSRFELLSSRLNRSSASLVGIGIDENLEESFGSYVCVLTIIPVTDPLENSYIEARLSIHQDAL